MSRVSRKTYFPALAIAAALVLSVGAINLFEIVQHRQVPYVGEVDYAGWDYLTFYEASQLLRDGASPYRVQTYVTPPLPALLNLPLTLFDFDAARQIFFGLSVAAMILACAVANQLLHRDDPSARAVIFLYGLGALLFSYPVYFLLDRGNIDGFAALLMCLGILLHNRSAAASGLGFALAISLKLYPALILAPLLIARRWRVVAATLIGLAALALLSPPALWRDFALRFLERADLFRSNENGSLASTFLFAAWVLRTRLNALGMNVNDRWVVDVTLFLSTAFYGLSLAVVAYADFKSGRKDIAAMAPLYFPFMVAVPKLVYHYEFIVLLLMIPRLCAMWKSDGDARTRRILGVMALGIILSQSQAVALDALTGKDASHFLPGLGLLMVMVSCVLYQVRSLEIRQSGLPPQPASQAATSA
jgi:hypothetical protein